MSEGSIRALPIWKGPVRIEPLCGGITNLNYLVTDGAGRYAARAGADDPKLGISRRNELECVRAAADLGVAPALVHRAEGIMICAFVEGTPLTPDLLADPSRQHRVTAALRRIHDHGPALTGHLRYFCPFQVARTYIALARDEDLALPAPADPLLDEVAALQARLAPFVPTFCHNDLMPANLLDTGDRIWVIDWEYAGIGHPLFDLAGLSSNCGFDRAQDEAFLAAYGTAPTPSFRVLKAMAALRESLWAVVQGSQSEIEFDYGAYREENYEKYRVVLQTV